jgi:hypothetical protein
MPESPSAVKSRSLLEQLPEIVRAGQRQVERILEGLEGRMRIGLQTRESLTNRFGGLRPPACDAGQRIMEQTDFILDAKAGDASLPRQKPLNQ